MKSKFSYYDSEIDDLIISNKEENEKVKRNFMFDDFIISITRSGKIVGLEIRNASKFLEESGLNPSILEKIKEAKLIIVPKRDLIYIGVIFIFEEKSHIIERKVPITHIPMKATLSN